MRGRNVETGEISVVRISPEGVGSGGEKWQGVYNPSFDVTPAELISAYHSVSFASFEANTEAKGMCTLIWV